MGSDILFYPAQTVNDAREGACTIASKDFNSVKCSSLSDSKAGTYSSTCCVGAMAVVVRGRSTAAAGAACAISATTNTTSKGVVGETGSCVKDVDVNAGTIVAGGIAAIQR